MNNRGYPRIHAAHLQADVSDGRDFYTGSVINLSRLGLAITDLAIDLDGSSDIFSVIIDGPGTHFKLLVRPVWEKVEGGTKTIGARIENSSWTWTEYVRSQESRPRASATSPS